MYNNKVMAFYLSKQNKNDYNEQERLPIDISGIEDGGHKLKELALKDQANDLLSKVNYLNHLFEEKNYLIIEVFAHQLKTYFNELQAEELKNLTFKMELAIRRKDFEEAHEKLLTIREIIRVFNKADI